MNAEVWVPWDDEERGGYGYDFVFTPVKPADPEYRQAHAEAQRLWLEHWMPYGNDWVQ